MRAAEPGTEVARITPELALVDPELRRRIQHWIPRKIPGRRPPLPSLRLDGEPPVIETDERSA
jgi:hypothetical protein